MVLNVPFTPRNRAFLRAGLTGIDRPRKRGDRDPEIQSGAFAGEGPANGRRPSCQNQGRSTKVRLAMRTTLHRPDSFGTGMPGFRVSTFLTC